MDRIEIHDNDNLAFVTEIATSDLKRHADHCKAIRDSGYNASKGDAGQVASVPMFMIQAFCNLKGIHVADFMRTSEWDEEFLNSPEIQGFRTYEGRL